ncbi:activity-dependent neuroprotector homeobox protein 2b [Hypomesus transpacificus]|uniref:activity-dependent neuroprotector homeobox protein 2b n=1 Tax=Hypomesus transpacificus TaxID=137520 RepID=UPI001F07A5C5|nr:activity-dependent neuroprotector homeobox protein 2b [Hypomesus transpacificus]
MYQIPVGSLDVIRKTRRKVKHVLSDIGLEDCQHLLEELQNSDPGDDVFLETEWTDLTEGFNGRGRKKWVYRTDVMCCNLCTYHTRNWRSFKYHIQREHEYERKICALSPCPLCPFVGHPKVVRKHGRLFHSISPAPSTAISAAAVQLITQKKGERYRCQKCAFRSSVLYAIKKHILLTHLGSILRQFSSKTVDPEQPHSKRYYCKDCQTSLENLDQMLHHVLVSPAHQLINVHVKPFIIDNRNYNTATYRPPTKSQVLAKSEPLQLINSLLVSSSNNQLVSSPVTGAPNSLSFMCVPGTNLPPQASALVQLASAEAKGLIKRGTPITFQSALPTRTGPATMPLGGIGPPTARLAISSSAASRQAQPPMGVPGRHPQQPWTQVLQQPLMVTQKLPLNQTTPQGTMLTSQSLLSHLIPTGKKINGMPTYTLAPLKMAQSGCMETPQNTGSPLQPIKPTSNSLPQAKRWVACPICNELFPSDVYEVHTEVVHKATSRNESMAAKAPFLRKMPDKTVKCLMCKVLVSEKGLLEHLLHGLDCMFCSQKFNSIKSFVDHSKEHNPSQKAYCEYIRREYRLYTNSSGKLLFPYFDINTTAPKEILGDTELNLALVTKSLDLIFLKMLPVSSHPVCSTPMKTVRTRCLFCDENCQTPDKYQEHLRHKHFVDTTVHAILKTAAFKCIYCNGVYTGRVTQRAIVFHLRRCQCAPKEPKNTEESMPPASGQPVLLPTSNKLKVVQPSPKLQNNQASVFYFAQFQQGPVVQAPLLQAKLLQAPLQQAPLQQAPLQQAPLQQAPLQQAPLQQASFQHAPLQQAPLHQAPLQQAPLQQASLQQASLQQAPLLQTPLLQTPLLQTPLLQTPLLQTLLPSPIPISSCEPEQSESEKLSKLRLEMAWKEAMEANKRERQERAAIRKRQELEREMAQATVQPEIEIDPTVQLALDPSGLEHQAPEERKDFLTRYFHKSPYLTKKESDELCKRLLLTKSEISLLFGNKRTKCLRTIHKHTAAVFLGFNMAELNKVRHNLLIPEVVSADLDETEEPEKSQEKEETADSSKQSESEEIANEEEPVESERTQLSEAINEMAESDT